MKFYLEQINPLVGLDEWQFVALLNQSQLGYFSRLQWAYHFIEKRNPYVRAVKRRILSAIGKLKWDIKSVEDAATQIQADAQAATLRAAYDKIANLPQSLNFLALAELRGYSHLEKIYDANLNVVELRIVEQWFWCREGFYAPWAYNPEAQEMRTGTPITFGNFIIREVGDPINEIMGRTHVRMETADGDWEEYLRDYGLPNIIIEGPPNVPTDKEAIYQTQAEKLSGGARGYIPNGANVHSVDFAGGDDAFKKRLEFLAETIVIGGTGGKLNILTERGSGTLAGTAVKDAFDELAESIAGEISAVMQAQFDKIILAGAHPGEPVLAYFEFAPGDAEDRTALLTDAKLAHDAGLEMDAADLSERTSYKLTRVAAPVATNAPGGPPAAAPSAGQGKMPSPAGETPTLPKQPAFPEAVARVLNVSDSIIAPAASVFDQLDALAADGQLTDAELADSAQTIIDRLPDIAREADLQPLINALAEAMLEAFNG